MSPAFPCGPDEQSDDRRVLLTRMYEFHLEGSVCVGVRRRSTGEWLGEHRARLRCIGGAVQVVLGDQWLTPFFPKVGEAAWFEPQGVPYVSGAILAIETPADSQPLATSPLSAHPTP